MTIIALIHRSTAGRWDAQAAALTTGGVVSRCIATRRYVHRHGQPWNCDMLTVRLDEQTERRLEALVRHTGRSRSEIVREAIRWYEPELPEDAGRTVYDGLSDVIGVGQRRPKWPQKRADTA